MKVLGLTGSIAMGKSTVAAMARRLGLAVFDADASVHRALAAGGRAVKAVALLCPEALQDGAIQRTVLGRAVFGQPERLRQLEAILHPIVRRDRQDFLAQQRRRRAPLVLLDIPLLFERDGWRVCDRVMVVTAPLFLQAARVLRRPGMTSARLQDIRQVQMSEPRKRILADYLIRTGTGKAPALRALRRAVTLAKTSQGQARCAKSYWIRKQPALIH